ncbi:SET domain-containing protein-lysine N-methyltransferase [Rhodanobacter sp. DHG33]|uniref:SET domain-containing protein-lysine N-methyltransferase n=1 Tax=Rhodanobacter sp. DHG33 TaxID=2775921 RepID=UPI00177CCB9E|nr:SET domain-containing protein-lysine N-methyltransferase [Rhodanobacter sp. DHG33]MBD8900437.1 SET domain-containing protein-lysine N-methyltransferase [Rhodanobacter sp. DHG33]
MIKDTGTAKGRGIFATRAILAGEIVEICPVVLVHADWEEMPKQVQRIVFDWGRLTKGPCASCIALGWGSIYNHGNPANIRYSAEKDSLSMVFTAARDIALGEELTINYNETAGDIHSSEDVWFQDTGITPI